MVEDVIRRHLTNDAERPSRARKRLRPNEVADWDLRLGELRVFYDIVGGTAVWINGVGTKDHDKLLIGGKEIRLDAQDG